MGREGASAPYWRYRSGREKLTMSTSRTAERPPSVVPAIAYRRTSLRSVRLAKPACASGALALTTTYLIKHNLMGHVPLYV